MKKSLALLAALASFSCAAPAPPPKPVAPKIVETPVVIDRPRAELLKKLDELVQWRFSKITPEDVRTRRFGLNRMGPSRDFHFGDLADASGIQVVGGLALDGWKAAVYVVRERDEAESAGKVVGPAVAGGFSWTAIEHRSVIEELAYRAMTTKTAVCGSSNGIPLEARMVPVSAPICKRCHAGKEIGDPVGAVVYAFHRSPHPSVATPGRESGR